MIDIFSKFEKLETQAPLPSCSLQPSKFHPKRSITSPAISLPRVKNLSWPYGWDIKPFYNLQNPKSKSSPCRTMIDLLAQMSNCLPVFS